MSLADDLRALVQRWTQRTDYYYPRPVRVVSQSADLSTVDVIPEDADMPHVQTVPIRHGIPGVRVRLASGSRCRLFFDDGNPSRPFVGLWDAGAVEEVSFDNGTQPVARVGDPVFVAIDATAAAAIVSAASTGGSVTLAGAILSGAPRTKA